MPVVLGLDIGGASLKAATSDGWTAAVRFALWKEPARLAETLQSLIASARFERIAVTMTGELCDGFDTKAEGVAHIVDSVQQAAPQDVPVGIWRTDGRFVSSADATNDPWLVASANWLALAVYAGRLAGVGRAMLMDIGSTTTDLVPIVDGTPVPRGMTDPDRLRTGELVYQGVRRTPVQAILTTTRAHFGESVPVMAEYFASSLDAYLVRGEIAEDPGSSDTADGRPETVHAAVGRLARMIGSDRSRFRLSDARVMADEVHQAQLAVIRAGLDRQSFGPIQTVILSGEGEFLTRQLIAEHPHGNGARVISLAEILGAERSRSACAVAVAELAVSATDF